MIITKSMKTLEKGTTIYDRKGDYGWYVLTSDYDEYHGGYTAERYELNDDDAEVMVSENILLTPSDLIDNEISRI